MLKPPLNLPSTDCAKAAWIGLLDDTGSLAEFLILGDLRVAVDEGHAEAAA